MFCFAKTETGHAFFQNKGGNSLYPFRFVSHGKYNVDFSRTRVGNENFAAVKNIVVASQNRHRLLRRCISPRIRFSQAERAKFFPFSQRYQVFAFLFFAAKIKNRHSTQRY